MISRILHVLTTVALLACGVSARAEYRLSIGNIDSASGIEAEAIFPYDQLPPGGFCPVHVRIKNRTNNTHTWTLQFTHSDNMFGSQNPATVVWRSELSVPSGKTGEWDLFVPLAGLNAARSGYMNLMGRITGYAVQRESFGVPTRYTGGIPTPFVLISDKLSDAAWSKLEAEVKTASPGNSSSLLSNRFMHSSRSGRNLEGSKVEFRNLPPDWRALSGVSGIWLTAAEWPSLSSDRRRAILQWIAGGGHLFVASEEASNVKLPELPALTETGKPVAVGFGSVETVTLQNKELPITETATSIVRLDTNAFPVWSGDHYKWSLVNSLGWPTLNVKLIVLFVSIFAVVIGPLNFRVFAPPKRRHRLFFTVPALSIVASILLFGVISVGDGFGGTGFRNALVYLPAGENTATISQEQISRARLLLGRTFTVPEDAQVSMVPLRSDNRGRVNLERAGKSATGDWFQSRTVQGQLLRAVVPTRAEVVIQNPKAAPGEKPIVLSSAAGLFRDLVYVDSTGQFWTAAEVPTGTPVTLKEIPRSEWQSWLQRNASQFSPHLQQAVETLGERPGYFYAVAESLPDATIATLPGISWTDKIVCFGPCLKGDVK